MVAELPKRGGWPEKVTHIGQDYDRELMFYGRGNVRTGIILDQLAVDHRECGSVGTRITREQYEAALAAKNDGWIEWGGWNCPVEKGTLIDVKHRDGEIYQNKPAMGDNNTRWSHTGSRGDIIAYRLHKPQEAEQAKADDESDLNECIGQDAAPVWSGEGQPPVGVECEYSWAGEPWASGVIRYISKHTIIIETQADSTGNTECAYHPTDIKLRPLRTEADRKRDEAVQALCNAGGGNGKVDDKAGYGSCWFDVYDAIAAGKIPGVKLED